MKVIIGVMIVLGIVAAGTLFFQTVQEAARMDSLSLKESYTQCITSFHGDTRKAGICLQKLS